VKHLASFWQIDLIEPIRRSRIRKFALYLDSPVTELVVKHPAAYAEFAFYISPAIHSLGMPLESGVQGSYGYGQDQKSLIYERILFVDGRTHRFPRRPVETLHFVRASCLNSQALVIPTWLDASTASDLQVTYQWPMMRDRRTVDINLTKFKEVDPLLSGGEVPAGFVQLQVPVLMCVPWKLS
jgi:hypothetical protein